MMKISYGTRFKKGEQDDTNGFGYAGSHMLKSLTSLDYEVNVNDPTADVEVWFDQPNHWKFSKGPYRIGYFPWESTKLLERDDLNWLGQLNSTDEVWTPSPLIADWLKDFMGITRPIYVYEHGVDDVWTPKRRKFEGGTFKFLHVGGEAARKGAAEAMQSMRLTFPRNVDVEINMKIISPGWGLNWMPRVNYINEIFDINRLVQLFHDCHVFVYPSYGEGFGLNPLQALATGMPTITLPAWAPYKDYLDPRISVNSDLVNSPWPMIHPGQMFKPDTESIREAMKFVYYNYESCQDFAHAQLDDLKKHYNWNRLTKEAFDNLAKRI